MNKSKSVHGSCNWKFKQWSWQNISIRNWQTCFTFQHKLKCNYSNNKNSNQHKTLKGTNKPFANVYKSPSWYPFVMFEPSELQSKYEDTANNYRLCFPNSIVKKWTKYQETQWTYCWNVLDMIKLWVSFEFSWRNLNVGEIDMESWPCLFVSTNLSCRVLVSIL